MQVWIRQSMPYRVERDGPMPFPVPGWMWDRGLGEQLYADRIPYMRRVDELGFDGLIFTEHHYGPNGGLTPSPIVMLAAATQATERIKLVTMGIALALYPHPVRVAEELAMVDNLSHGRLVVGLISSGAQSLYAYSVSPTEEPDRYHEAYELVERAWTDENPFEWHGEYYDYECVSILPRPLQVPHPPIWTTAARAESLEWAAAHHVGLIASGATSQAAETLGYYQRFAESECGWTPTRANRGLAREFFIAPTKAEVQERVDELMGREADEAYPHMFTHPRLVELQREKYNPRSYAYRSESARERQRGRTAAGIESGSYLIGDPDSLTERILDQRKECDADVLIIRPEMGGMSLEQVAERLELFAREVLPVVQRA